MAIPTFLSTFEGNLLAQTRDSVVTLTSSGPVRYVDGAAPGSQAYVAEEGTTNIVPNPWHAVDAAGWTGTTRDTSWAVQGPASGLMTASGAGAEATIPINASASAHTVQAIVRNNAASARTFQLRYNSTDAGDAVVVAAGAERTITASITGTGSSAALGVQVTDSEAAETYNVGYLGCEQKSYATSPCPAIAANGDIIAGYSWAGTAHASASTRVASYAQFADNTVLNPDEGEVVVRYRAPNLPSTTQGIVDTTVNIWRLLINIGGALQFLAGNQGTTIDVSSTPDDEVATVSAAWKVGEPIAIRSLDKGAVAFSLGSLTTPFNAGNQPIRVGITAGGNPLNGAIDGVAIFDRPLTDAERTKLTNAPTWAWETLVPRFGGIHVIPVTEMIPAIDVLPVIETVDVAS